MHIQAVAVSLAAVLMLGLVSASPAAYLHQHNPHNIRYGRHNKLPARSNADAPYGYDRCGWPRKTPYTRRDNKVSPRPSASHKPCVEYGPGAFLGKNTIASTTTTTTTTTSELELVQEPQQQQQQQQQQGGGGIQNFLPSLFTPISTPNDDVVASTSQQSPSPSPNSNGAAVSSPSSSASSSGPTKSVDAGFAVENGPPPVDGKTIIPPVAVSPSSSSSRPAPSKSSVQPVPTPSSSAKPGDPSTNTSQTPTNISSAVQHDARKLGLAWDWRNPSGSMHNWQGVSQAYTWSEWPPVGGMPDGASWLPMFTCTDKAAGFAAQVAAGAIHPGMDILTFNEPDQPGQCPLSPADAASAFRELITKPYANKGYTLWSPAPTNSPTGRQWLTDFMNMCSDCGIDGVAIHWYGTDADNLISYVQGVYDQFKMPIKVTEFAPMDFTYQSSPLSTAQISAFLAKTQAWLNAQSFITGYYFFGAVTTPALGGVNPNVKLIDDGGAITSLGWQYLGNGR